MTHTPHELVEEFPDKADRIHELKTNDRHFRRLFDEYHDVNRAVHRAEINVEPIDPMAEQVLRKKRMHLKDELSRMIG